MAVRLGNGDGTLRPGPADVPVGAAPHGIAVGDFDGDGHEDLAVADSRASGVSVRLGNGDGDVPRRRRDPDRRGPDPHGRRRPRRRREPGPRDRRGQRERRQRAARHQPGPAGREPAGQRRLRAGAPRDPARRGPRDPRMDDDGRDDVRPLRRPPPARLPIVARRSALVGRPEPAVGRHPRPAQHRHPGGRRRRRGWGDRRRPGDGAGVGRARRRRRGAGSDGRDGRLPGRRRPRPGIGAGPAGERRAAPQDDDAAPSRDGGPVPAGTRRIRVTLRPARSRPSPRRWPTT